MPTSHAQTFTLLPYPGTHTGGMHSITGQIARFPDRVLVSYRLEGDLSRIRIPEGWTPRFADELWRHTCLELFVARKGEPPYHEFNFSPSGEWAAYAFASYRERAPRDAGAELAGFAPGVIVRRMDGNLTLDAAVRLNALSPGHGGARLVIGISAVVEAESGFLSYWALRHPGPKPDFHHPDAFVLEFDEIRH